MRFIIHIKQSPHHQSSQSAWRFCQEAMQQGHRIELVFFQDLGVLHANTLLVTPTDEACPTERWKVLAKQHQVRLATCSNSALKYGVVNTELAKLFDKPCSNHDEVFKIIGLTEFFAQCEQADKVVSF